MTQETRGANISPPSTFTQPLSSNELSGKTLAQDWAKVRPVSASKEVDIKDAISGAVRSGVLLINVVNGSKYSPEIRALALDRMRSNVLGCSSWEGI